MRGLLVKQIPVRLVNVSLSGFLIESERNIDIGSTGSLEVDLDGTRYGDQVRVARTVTRSGTSLPYHLGGEFSWANRPRQDSVRLAVRSIEERSS